MIGVIILNYNTWRETINCIESLDQNYNKGDITVYVVDNKSPQRPDVDESVFFKRRNDVILIEASANKGYSAGNNIGIKRALEDGCEYIVISNSDILFVDKSLYVMSKYIDENKTVGVVGPQILDVNGVFQPFHMMSKLTAWGKLQYMLLQTPFSFLARSFKNKFVYEKELTIPIKVFSVLGCCFMMSRDCASYLYPLDERTFLYEEEYIMGAILENSPYSVYILPNTNVIHAFGVSIGKVSRFSYKCLMDSEQIYLKEYLHSNILVRKFFLYLRKFFLARL